VKHISPLPLDNALQKPVFFFASELTVQTYPPISPIGSSSDWNELKPTKDINAKAGNTADFKCFLIIVLHFKLMNLGLHFP
jgi:hypothetical protein